MYICSFSILARIPIGRDLLLNIGIFDKNNQETKNVLQLQAAENGSIKSFSSEVPNYATFQFSSPYTTMTRG
jgi:hypothetical protein